MSTGPWHFEWTSASIREFWAWMGANRAQDYFARSRGWSILDHVRRYLPADGPYLDLGAGTGDLTAILLARKKSVYAVEDAPTSLAQLRTRFAGEARFLEALESTSTLQADAVSAVFAVEVVEHLTGAVAAELWRDTYRILRPKGVLIVTTPHDEQLLNNTICCPHCHATFHTIQHVRTFSSSSLRAEFESAGFHTLRCEPVYFSLLRGFHARLEWARRRLGRHPRPHLLYVGVRA